MKLLLLTEQYARALRVIGQDLAELLPEALTIEVSGENFVARGCGNLDNPACPNDAQRAPSPTLWQKLSTLKVSWPSLKPEPARTPEAARSMFLRTYTPADINSLDAAGRAKRKNAAQRPDLHSIAEKLRMIGRILDEKNAALIELSQEGNSVRFRYRDSQGETQSEEYSNLTLYKLQQQYYSGRCFHPRHPWASVQR